MAAKTWQEKFATRTSPEVVRLEKDFGGASAGSRMLIATPKIIEDYVRQLPAGQVCSPKTMRSDLAAAHHADVTCPLTTGIFTRIMAEANYEKLARGASVDSIAPFWRAIDPNGPLARKLTFGKDFLIKQLEAESGMRRSRS